MPSQAEEPNNLNTPSFSGWDSYRSFAQAVLRDRRYVWTPEIHSFLATVLATAEKRAKRVAGGTAFFRAQKGIDRDEDHSPMGYLAKRMRPLPDKASEGRANPLGIPVLYLATSAETAVAETRPWIGAEVSVGVFRTTKDLKVVDLVQDRFISSFNVVGLSVMIGDTTPSQEKVTEAVWADIDHAFSRPYSRDETGVALYAPTQIITELFKDAGFDGIAYNSRFNGGRNLALFDLSSAEIQSCAPYTVESVEIAIKQNGNDWFASPKR